ncbi:MAG: hypothetical protein WBX15_16595 [Thermoanaerobaculia bacterium]
MKHVLWLLAILSPILLSAGGALANEEQKPEEIRTVHGVACDRVVPDLNGVGERCRTSGDQKLFGSDIPAGSWLHFASGDTPDWLFLSKDTSLDGHVCRGEGAGSWMTALHPDGRLRLCWLAEHETIDGVPCRRAGLWSDSTRGSVGVVFHENGRLRQCEASHPFAREGHTFKRGETIRLDEKGNVIPGQEPPR